MKIAKPNQNDSNFEFEFSRQKKFLTWDNDWLGRLQNFHIPKSFVSDGKNMRRHGTQRFSHVSFDGSIIIQIPDIIIRIDGDQNVGHKSVNLILVVAQFDVLQ